MSKITERQSSIFNFIKELDREVKRSEIIDQFSHWYYCNSGKHISDILHRMVNNGLLKKERSGYYQIGDGKSKSKKATEVINENQTELFKT